MSVVKCSWCSKKGQLGNGIKKLYIDGRLITLCSRCQDLYHAKGEQRIREKIND